MTGRQHVFFSSSKKKLLTSQKGVAFHALSKAGHFHCAKHKVDGRRMSYFVLGQNRCAGVVFLYKLSGGKPYKEGPAKEQAVAGVKVFTWNKEDLGLSPMCVRPL